MTTNGIETNSDKLDRAVQHLGKSEYLQAEQLANEVLATANGSVTLSKETEARALNILGKHCSLTGRYDDALTHFQKASAAAEAASDLGLQSAVLIQTATVHLLRSEFNNALHTAEQALALAERAEDNERIAGSSMVIGNVKVNLADYPNALDSYASALALAEKIGDKRMVAGVLVGIAIAVAELGDYASSLDYSTRSLEIEEEIADKTYVVNNLISIAAVHGCLGDYTRVLDYTSRALAIAEEVGDQDAIAINLGNMGAISIETGDYNRALEYFYRALDISEQIGACKEISNWKFGIAIVGKKLGNLDAAYQGLMAVLEYRREVLKSDHEVGETCIELGRILIEQGKTEEGLTRLEEALALALRLSQKNQASEAHKEIADAYAKMGDIAKAYEHSQKHYAIKEEIFSDKSRQLIDSFNIRAAIANQERDTELQRLRAERSEHETEAQKARAEQSEKELGNTTLHLLAQTELLSDLRADLLQIARKFPPTEPAARELRERVKNLPCQSIDWEKFDTQFKAAHPEFVKKLLERFPELTPMEVRVCTLLRLNLKSHEIAKMFCLEERSIETHRFNIRKKLKLETKQSLSNFLNAL